MKTLSRTVLQRTRRLSRRFRRGRDDRQAQAEPQAHPGGVAKQTRHAEWQPGAREAARGRSVRWLSEALTDLRYGSRMLVRTPASSLVAVLSLAIGIGANTAIFSLADQLLIQTLPVRDAERLVVVAASRGQGLSTAFSFPDFVDYRDRSDAFDALVASYQRAFTLSDGGEAERISGLIVSGNYFTGLGVQPALGRGFLPEDDTTPGTHPVVVLGDGLWRRRFGGDPNVVGRTVHLNGYAYVVVGVTPSRFTGTIAGSRPDVYVPIMMWRRVAPSEPIDLLFGPRERLSGWLQVLGRLKPGVSRERAAAAMTALGGQIARAHPNPDGSPRVPPQFVIDDGRRGHTNLLRDITLPLQILIGIVALVLIIACANVANLLLARAGARQQEIAIRLAAGAGRTRILRQLLTEGALLSALGGCVGLALAATLSGVIVGFAPPNNSAFASLILDARFDLRVLGFTVVITLLTGLVFSLAPALVASKPDLVPTLKAEATGTSQTSRPFGLLHVLVVVQVAISAVVLVGAGLCVRSLRSLAATDTGFDPTNVLVASIDLSLSGYDPGRGLHFYEELLDRVQRLPGVDAASLATQIALGDGFGAVMRAEGHVPKSGEDLGTDFNQIAPDYFRVMRIPMLDGREFSRADTTTAPLVAIINETAARRYWPGQSPIGRRVVVGLAPYEQVRVVVGVVKDSKYRRITEDVRPSVFTPFLQRYRGDMTLHVRTAGEPSGMFAAVRREVQALDDRVPIYNIRTLEEQKTRALYTSRLAATLLTTFGLLAALLATVGLYGVMTYAVNRRRREIGIRLALGAQGQDVRRLVLVEGASMVAAGLLLGTGGALAGTRLLQTVLHGVSETDPVAYVSAILLLTTVALVASYLPARQASRTNPLVAIRQ